MDALSIELIDFPWPGWRGRAACWPTTRGASYAAVPPPWT